MSSDSNAPLPEGGEKTERMDRLRALLTKPIKIPESASADGTDADYTAPVAATALPAGGKPRTRPQGATTRSTTAPGETPPAVKAAAEALDRLTDQERQAGVHDATESGRPTRSRHTWADAYLTPPERSLTPQEVRTELTTALEEQGAELRELSASQAAAQEKAQALAEAQQRTAAEVAAAVGLAATAAHEEAARLRERIEDLATTTDALRTDLAAAHAAAATARSVGDSATTAASEARETARAATEQAATASKLARVGMALAAVTTVVAVLALVL